MNLKNCSAAYNYFRTNGDHASAVIVKHNLNIRLRQATWSNTPFKITTVICDNFIKLGILDPEVIGNMERLVLE